MKEKPGDGRSPGVLCGKEAQLLKEELLIGSHGRLHHEGRFLPPGLTKTDEGAADDLRVQAENLFTGLRVQDAGGGGDTLGDPAAEPKTARGVDVAGVAHAVPDRGRAYLRGGGGLGQRIVSPGDRGAGDDDLAGFARWKFVGGGE